MTKGASSNAVIAPQKAAVVDDKRHSQRQFEVSSLSAYQSNADASRQRMVPNKQKNSSLKDKGANQIEQVGFVQQHLSVDNNDVRIATDANFNHERQLDARSSN